MKLVICGLTVSSSWGNGHATIWRGLCQALGRHGHRVIFFERDVPYYAAHRDLHDLPGGKLVLYGDWDEVRLEAELELRDADAGIVTSYCPDALAAAQLVLDSPAVHVFYDLDTPVTLDQLEQGEPVDYIGPRGLADFDLVLSYTGGKALDQLKARLGARRVAPLYGSADPELHRPRAPSAQFAADLSYIGTYAADRQPALEALFLEPARQRPEQRFLIAGAQYPADFPWLPNIFFVRHVAPPDHAALYCSSRLTLNITRQAMVRMGSCPSGRLFEAAACGTPILSDWWEGLDVFFTPGKEILIARSPADTLSALDLADTELARIAADARERTLAEHTAEQRVRDFESAMAAVRSEMLRAPAPQEAAPATCVQES